MATQNQAGSGATSGVSQAERSKKRSETRSVNAAIVGRMDESVQFAFKQIQQCRRTISEIEDLMLAGKRVAPQMLQSLAGTLQGISAMLPVA